MTTKHEIDRLKYREKRAERFKRKRADRTDYPELRTRREIPDLKQQNRLEQQIQVLINRGICPLTWLIHFRTFRINVTCDHCADQGFCETSGKRDPLDCKKGDIMVDGMSGGEGIFPDLKELYKENHGGHEFECPKKVSEECLACPELLTWMLFMRC